MEARHVLGIDVGTATIKVFAGEMDTNGQLAVIGSGAVTTVGFAKGAISDVRTLAAAIKEAVDCALLAAGVPIEMAYLGIGGLGLHSANNIGSVAPASAAGISRQDIERVHLASVLACTPDEREALHVLPLRYWVDGKKELQVPVRRKGARLEVETHVVTAPKAVITQLIDSLQLVGITVTGVVANVIVASQLLASEIATDNCLVMDIGAGIIDLAIFQGGQIQMSASLPIGGEYITSDLMQGLQVTHLHAEGIKRYYGKMSKSLYGQGVELDCNDYGTKDKIFVYDFLYQIIESRVEEIAAILFEFAKPLLAQYNIDRMYLTGGCALMPSLLESIGQTFGLEPEILQASGLSSEYAHPTSTACFGILNYAMNIQPKVTENKTSWQSILNKWKNFF